MPGLVFGGRRSSIVAGDDLEWYCFVVVGLRIVEVVLLIPAMVLSLDDYAENPECFDGIHNRIGVVPVSYITVSVIVAALSIAIAIAIFIISGRGSPTEPEKRRGVGVLFSIQMFIMPFILLLLVISGIREANFIEETAWCLDLDATLPSWAKAMIAAICFQFAETCLQMMYLTYRVNEELSRRLYRRSKRRESSRDDCTTTATPRREERVERWENRCQCCCQYTALFCCFSFGGQDIRGDDFASISEALADLFQGWKLDIVPSDIKMGLHMLGLLQEERKQRKLKAVQAELDTFGREESEDQSDVIDLALRGIVEMSDALREVLNMTENNVGAGKSQNDREPGARQGLAYKAILDSAGLHHELSARDLVSPDSEADRYAIAEGSHFLKYSEAINTWKNFLFTRPATGCCELCFAESKLLAARGRLACKSPSERIEAVTMDDNFFRLHQAAFLEAAGFDRSKAELAYAYFNKQNSVEEAVYCIIVDHVWKSVVVCVRGSLSLGDYVINLDITPVSLECVGEDFRDEFCHKGYLARAKWIIEDMERHKILESLLSDERGKFGEYDLRITGHSLGAGTAAPLALMMRRQYPNLRCLCYAAPGGLFSLGMARKCEEFVTTFVTNSDLVPRISASTIRLLRDEVLDLIARIKVPKREIMKLRLTDTRLEDLHGGLSAFLHEEGGNPESDYSRELTKFKDHLRSQQEEDLRNCRLYPPGRIFHLVKTSERDRYREMLQGYFPVSNIFNFLTCNRYLPREEFTPRWADLEDFSEIIVSKTLVSDHMAEYIHGAIDSVAARFGIDPTSPP